MIFGDGTHSKGDPNIAHLTFTQKSKCGGRMVRTLPHVPSTPKITLVKNKNDNDSSILLKRERKENMIYIKKETNRELKNIDDI